LPPSAGPLLDALCRGDSNSELGRLAGISSKGAASAVSRYLRYFNAVNRAHLAALWVQCRDAYYAVWDEPPLPLFQVPPRPALTAMQRLELRMTKLPEERGGCWLWKSREGERPRKMRRELYKLLVRPLASNEYLYRTDLCRYPSCVNPLHWQIGPPGLKHPWRARACLPGMRGHRVSVPGRW
jgi:hypothetical protein